MGLDWKKEYSEKDLCGYCDGYVTRCNGSCFTEARFGVSDEDKKEYLTLQIEIVQKRLNELKEELKLLNGNNEKRFTPRR